MSETGVKERIAVGVDAVDGAWLASRAVRLAGRVGARVDVLAPDRALGDAAMADVPDELRGAVTLTSGRAIDAWIEASADYDAFVVRPRSSGLLERLVHGDASLRMASEARCAVLVPRGPDRPWQSPLRALVGVYLADPGVPFLMAIDWASRLHALLDVSLTDPNVTPWIDDPNERQALQASIEDARAEDRRALDRLLADLPAELRGERRHGEGLPDDVLVDLSSEYDLVLVGNRPRGGLAGTFRGSIAEHVVRNAHADVLVLPSRQLVSGVSR